MVFEMLKQVLLDAEGKRGLAGQEQHMASHHLALLGAGMLSSTVAQVWCVYVRVHMQVHASVHPCVYGVGGFAITRMSWRLPYTKSCAVPSKGGALPARSSVCSVYLYSISLSHIQVLTYCIHICVICIHTWFLLAGGVLPAGPSADTAAGAGAQGVHDEVQGHGGRHPQNSRRRGRERWAGYLLRFAHTIRQCVYRVLGFRTAVG